jgi:hypothetical protein
MGERIKDREGCEYETELEMLWCSPCDGFGFCGCGDRDPPLRAILNVLTRTSVCSTFSCAATGFEEHGWYWKLIDFRDPIDWLAVYVCDRADLIEHGTSVRVGWLTQKGERAIELILRYFAETEADR